MSKGNLLLGFARGSIGDVTFSRSNGEQVARARNRQPANPNTESQAIQRAVTASVARLYSMGQSIFNHAFQGLKVGAENQQEFMKRNMALLRSLVLSDINNGRADGLASGRISAPGLSIPVPFVGMQVSNGNYPQEAFRWNISGFYFALPAALSGETIAAYCSRVRLVADDIYTFGLIGIDTNDSVIPLYTLDPANKYASIFQPYFNYLQLKVKASAVTSSEPMSAALVGTLFDVIDSSVGSVTTESYDYHFSLTDLLTQGSDDGVIFCIRSREFEDLRSTSFAHGATSGVAYGLSSNYLISAWKDHEAFDQTDLILEGKDFL